MNILEAIDKAREIPFLNYIGNTLALWLTEAWLQITVRGTEAVSV